MSSSSTAGVPPGDVKDEVSHSESEDSVTDDSSASSSSSSASTTTTSCSTSPARSPPPPSTTASNASALRASVPKLQLMLPKKDTGAGAAATAPAASASPPSEPSAPGSGPALPPLALGKDGDAPEAPRRRESRDSAPTSSRSHLEVALMLPMFSCPLALAASPASLNDLVRRKLGLATEDAMEAYQLTRTSDLWQEDGRMAVFLPDADLTLQQVEELMEERDVMRQRAETAFEAVVALRAQVAADQQRIAHLEHQLERARSGLALDEGTSATATEETPCSSQCVSARGSGRESPLSLPLSLVGTASPDIALRSHRGSTQLAKETHRVLTSRRETTASTRGGASDPSFEARKRRVSSIKSKSEPKNNPAVIPNEWSSCQFCTCAVYREDYIDWMCECGHENMEHFHSEKGSSVTA